MRRFFRGPGDAIALAFVVLTMAAMLCALAYTKGVSDERISRERRCGADRWECLARERGCRVERSSR